MTASTPTLATVSRASAAPARNGVLDFRKWSRRTASLVSGIALSLMAGIMIAGYFAGIMPLIVPGDAAATAAAISGSPMPYLAGVVGIFLVTILDVIVAASWYALFKGVNTPLSAVAASLRVLFAALFAFAATQLVVAFALVDQPGAALAGYESFHTIWLISLGLFGIFLILEGYLGFRSGFMAKIFPILLAGSGVGYIADAIGVAFVDGFVPTFGFFGFVGEVAFILWLLIRGRRLTDR
jgi:hypothetical protein